MIANMFNNFVEPLTLFPKYVIKNKKFWNIKKSDEIKTKIKVIVGDRNPGKTTGFFLKAFQYYLDTGIPSGYIRRYFTSDIKVMVKKFGDWKFAEGTYCDSGGLYHWVYDKNKKKEKKYIIMFYALSMVSSLRGMSSGIHDLICFDEFINPKGRYENGDDEYDDLFEICGSLGRLNSFTLYMFANRNKRNNPYFNVWRKALGNDFFPLKGKIKVFEKYNIHFENIGMTAEVNEMYKQTVAYTLGLMKPELLDFAMGESFLESDKYIKENMKGIFKTMYNLTLNGKTMIVTLSNFGQVWVRDGVDTSCKYTYYITKKDGVWNNSDINSSNRILNFLLSKHKKKMLWFDLTTNRDNMFEIFEKIL